jgi:hypothetical protein
MYIMLTACYPPSKTDEVVKKYMEVIEQFPPDESIAAPVFPGGVWADDKGINSVQISEVKEGKFKEAMMRIARAAAQYRNIEGYRYHIRTLIGPEDALSIVGAGS